jgi:hypothetical protein
VNAAALTRCQHRLLEYLVAIRDAEGKVLASTRALADSLALSRRTVQAAINVLNELGFLKTLTGSPTCVSEHVVQRRFEIQPVLPGGGAICGKRPQEAQIAPGWGGAKPQQNPQAPGAIQPVFPQPLYKEPRASETNSLTVRSEEDLRRDEWVSEFLGSDGAEIVDFVEIGLSERLEQSEGSPLPLTRRGVALDALTRARFVALPGELNLSPADVCKVIGGKLADLQRRRFRCDHPKVLLKFVVDQVHKDRGEPAATRRPPTWEYGKARFATAGGAQ